MYELLRKAGYIAACLATVGLLWALLALSFLAVG